tara:strand:+ start:544 stop:846 length:303 start_codon:yes stop_codon:yes gene_type:complete
MNFKSYTRGEEGFEEILNVLEKKYFHNGGDEEAETIVNWHKQEAKEDGVICIFASNSVISNSIKRCRKGIKKVEVLPVGANLYFYTKYVRPLHMVLKVTK